MKKFISFAIILSSFFLFAFFVNAQNIRENKIVTLKKGEVINDTYFVSGDSVNISGTVNGDVYVAGGNVTIDGTVNGDVLGAGGNLNISGNVSDDVRIAGGQINISGIVGGNLTAGGGNITLTDSAVINKGVVIGGGSVSILSSIGKSATIGAGQLVIGNLVNGNVLAVVGQLSLTSNARIQGDLTYYSEEAADMQGNAYVTGKSTHNIPQKPIKAEKSAQFAAGGFIFFKLLSFLSALIIGFILLKLTPVFTKETTDLIAKKFWANLGVGFAVVFLAPIAFIILLITVIGAPIAFFFFFFYLILLCLSKIFVSYYIGTKVIKSNNKNIGFLAFFVGLLIYFVLTLIPFIGWIVSIFALFVGVGAITTQKKLLFKSLKLKKLI